MDNPPREFNAGIDIFKKLRMIKEEKTISLNRSPSIKFHSVI